LATLSRTVQGGRDRMPEEKASHAQLTSIISELTAMMVHDSEGKGSPGHRKSLTDVDETIN